jgi:hypothetical protein
MTMTNETKTYNRSSIVLVGFLISPISIVGNCLVSSTALAGEFHFIVRDVENGAAAWSPREVVIHKSTDLEGGLLFVLENPTPRTHVFEAPGLFEQIIVEGSENKTVKPMRVYLAPGETVRVQVSTEELNRVPEADVSETQTCQFFCPLHTGEEALRSQIRVVP